MNRWAFDIGNTRIKCAPVSEDDTLGPVTAIAHAGAGQAYAELAALLPPRGGSAYVCSVAPVQVSLPLIELLATRFRCVSLARSTNRFAGVSNAYPVPPRLGVDRFLALVAARARGPGAWLVCGVGTALTVDLLDSQGRHRGGRIAPSPALMRTALHQAAPHLPSGGGQGPIFAVDTEDALASGCDGAALGLIYGSLADAARVLGCAPGVLLHGGGAFPLVGRVQGAQHEPSLVLHGLARWARAAAAAPANL